jgi:hypothetical protein
MPQKKNNIKNDYSSLKHASHNEKVCMFLSTDEFNDWVITTAFYSSLHYLRHKIFPLSISKEKTYPSFDIYYNCLPISKKNGKHAAMRLLVEEECPEDISTAYNRLMDTCFTARYNKYKYSNKIAKSAKKWLNPIKAYSLKD